MDACHCMSCAGPETVVWTAARLICTTRSCIAPCLAACFAFVVHVVVAVRARHLGSTSGHDA